MTTDTNRSTDIINQLSAIQPSSSIADLRAQRPDVVEHAQRSYETIFAPGDDAGLTLSERLQAALQVALLEECQPLIIHYRGLLAKSGATNDLSPRTRAILRHVDLLTLRPAVAAPSDLQALLAAGLSVRNIVTLSQLIAFLSFQVRIVAILQLLDGQQPNATSSLSQLRMAAMQPFAARSEFVGKQGFTLETIGWDAWLEALRLEDATPEQIAVLEESTPTAKTSPYYLLLVQDVDVLRARSRLYNAIMYGPRGLRRADRELGALAVSRVNGCPYCASIHAQRFAQLTKQPEIALRVWQEGVETALETRQRAIVDFAAKLTISPNALTPEDLAPLRQAELSDWEMLDLAHACAMFAWANRLMQTLGEPVSV